MWGLRYVREHRGFHDRRYGKCSAEIPALIVMHHFGMATSEYCFPCVATWVEDLNRLRQNLVAVQKTSTTLIQSIERERLEERGARA